MSTVEIHEIGVADFNGGVAILIVSSQVAVVVHYKLDKRIITMMTAFAL